MRLLITIGLSIIITCSFAQVSFFKNAGLNYYKVRYGEGFQHPDNNYFIAWNISNGMTWSYRIAQYDSNGTFLIEDYIPLSFYNVTIQDFQLIYNEYLYLKGSGYRLSDGYFTSFSLFFDKDKNPIFSFKDTSYLSKIIEIGENTLIGILTSKHDYDTFIQYNHYITSIDLNGNVKWIYSTNNISDSLGMDNLKLRDISVNSNIVYCYFVDEVCLKSVFIKISYNGELLEVKTSNNYYDAFSIEKAHDGLFVFCSQRNIDSSQFMIYKLSNNYLEEWSFSGPKESKSQIKDFKIDKDGVLNLIIYHSNNSTYNSYGFSEIVKINSEGLVLANYHYYIEDNWLQFNKFTFTNDHGYLILLDYEDFYPYFSYFMKTDSDGFVQSNKVNYVTNYIGLTKTYKANICPNPMNRYCTFNIHSQPSQFSTLNLYNLQGKVVRQENFAGEKYILERKELKAGMYLYRIVNEKGSFTGKLIVTD